MAKNQVSTTNGEETLSFDDFNLNATHLISNDPKHKNAKLIEELKVKVGEQSRILLGVFTEGNPPKGFSLEVSPDPEPAGSVISEVISLGTAARYKLVMHITNYGIRTIKAEVWRL